MKRILSAQALMSDGKIVYSGLFDEDGNPVEIELENEDGCTLMTIVCDTEDDDDIEDDCEGECTCEKWCGEIPTYEEIEGVCRTQFRCCGCQLHDRCNPTGGDI